MNDFTAPEFVEVQIRRDGTVIWVNVNGICEFRACKIGSLSVVDYRREVQDSPEVKMSETEKCVWCGETERKIDTPDHFVCGSASTTDKTQTYCQSWLCIRRQVEQLEAEVAHMWAKKSETQVKLENQSNEGNCRPIRGATKE